MSITILALISTATVMTLNTARPGEEMRAASRILMSEIKNLSSRAFSGANVSACETVAGTKVCSAENPSQQICIDACTSFPPPRFGFAIADVPTASVALFADFDGNGRLTNDGEIISTVALNPLGGDKASIRSIASPGGDLPSLTLTMDRQNGRMRINACGDANLPPCGTPEPDAVTITLTHTQSATISSVISIDAKTGRVSSTL